MIAIAGKSIEGLSWLKAQRMKRYFSIQFLRPTVLTFHREQAESDLKFLGLIIFENRLKPGTAPAIQILRSAHLACRMITGDNPLTAVSVARECGLIHQAAHVFSPAFIRGLPLLFSHQQLHSCYCLGNASNPTSKLEWSCMDDFSWKLDHYSLKPLAPPPHHTVQADEISYQDYSLVVTGDAFRWLINYAPLETLQRVGIQSLLCKILNFFSLKRCSSKPKFLHGCLLTRKMK